MSNYHVEPIDKPAALTKEAIKSLRKQQVQGLSRRQLMRAALGHRDRPVAARGHGRHARLHLAEPRGRLRGADPDRRRSRRQAPELDAADRRGLPGLLRRGPRVRDPRRPGAAAVHRRRGHDRRRRRALNVRALYQRCPHLGCKPNPCLKNFWLECPCHGSRYDRLGIKAEGAQYGPAPRGMDRFSISVDGAGVLTIDTGKITLGPLPVALGQPGHHPAAHADGLHLMAVTTDRPPRSPMSDTPGREPEQRLPVPRPPAEAAPVERFTSPPPIRARRADARSGPPRSSASRRTRAGSASWRSSSSSCSSRSTGSTSSAPLGLSRAAARGRGRRPAGHRGRARLQRLRGQLRALPRRERRGRHRSGPQPPGQAVRAPQRGLPATTC